MPSPRATWRLVAGIAFAATLGSRSARAVDDAPTEPLIRYSNDTLTVRLNGVPTSKVLEELARESGAAIRGQVRVPRDVTADFEAVPLPEALARLPGDQDFALVYGKG